MKEIILKNDNSEVKIDSNLTYYLFSFFFLEFLDKTQERKMLIISNDEINNLYNLLEAYLIKILNKWYKEPTEKELQKYSSRYEKIKLNTKVYKIDYRSSEIGRLIFLIFNVLKLLKESNLNDGKLSIYIKHDNE
ncbi:hypothetical protein H5J24_06775 [Chryseobacterium capnotolerans]|uniref:hypothetical protein n=1 Tax=Chryseobacterium TaxID=59732 RepID=UPI00083A48FD|nr:MULTISPECIES: hypothetical protein [Chryseobacterium]UHO39757.1 hypothetical protein H5J24_06775 [Chryseobacterium capnotolerans]